MGGVYPDVPGHRMAYHLDGTEGFLYQPTGAFISQLTPTDMAEINDEDDGQAGNIPQSGWLSLRFPEPRTIAGSRIFHNPASSGPGSPQGSNDSTNGFDGTWTTLTMSGTFHTGSTVNSTYRTVSTVTANGGPWRWIRIQKSGVGNTVVRCWHIYGSASPEVDRLAIWHPTLDEEVDGAYFDWDDVPRDSSQDKTFRIKNVSASADTSGGIDITMESPTGDLETQHLLSTDGSNFFGSISIGNLTNGSISGVLTLRFAPSSTYSLSVLPSGVMYIKATPGAWS